MAIEQSARKFWKSCGLDAPVPTIDEVRAGSGLFRRKIVRRNLVEYVACVLVVVIFSVYTIVIPQPLSRIGSGLVVLGTLVVAWQLHKRAWPLPPEVAGEMSVYGHLRAQLARQRDALASIFWWYLFPLVPGLVLMMFGRSFEGISKDGASALPWVVLGTAFVVVVFYGIWWLNRKGARFLQAKIDEIDALMGEKQ